MEKKEMEEIRKILELMNDIRVLFTALDDRFTVIVKKLMKSKTLKDIIDA